MPLHFDLIDEPWIPCLLPNDSQVDLGLRDVLHRAHELGAVVADSPPITGALHRLLLAVLHRCTGTAGKSGPRNVDAWADLWERRQFDAATIDRYLDRCSDRFDLFDASRPFYQTSAPEVDQTKAVSIGKLLFQSDNNPTLFDHATVAEPPRVSAALAARLAIAYQAFDTAGLITGTGTEKSARASPLLQCAVVIVRGANLFQTLMLNLHRYSPENEVPWAFQAAKDLPAWEREDQVRPDDRTPAGYLDLLTWQSRRIRLWPEEDADGQVVVREATVMKGFQIPNNWSRADRETMLGFVKRLKPLPGQDPWPPLGFQEDRALWRDSLVLIDSFAEDSMRPKNLAWLAALAQRDVISRMHSLSLDALGLAADRAKLLFWRHERLTLPLPYLDDEGGAPLRARLREALRLAEDVGRTMGSRFVELQFGEKKVPVPSPFRRMAQELLGANAPVEDFVRHLAPARAYWALLGEPFGRLLADLPLDVVQGESGNSIYGGVTIPAWRQAVRRVALAAFTIATEGMDQAARTMRAVSLAEYELRRQLNALAGAPQMPSSAGRK